MNRKLLSVVIAASFAGTAAAQDLGAQWVMQGAITLGPIVTDIDSPDSSKAEQYRDLSDGALSSIEFRARNAGGYWLDFFGENIGRDDLYLNVRGGRYDAFRYRLFTDWVPQNRLFGGITPFHGGGSGELRATFPNLNPGNWNPLHIGFDRKDTGGHFEWQQATPWYFRVEANQVRREGTKIGSGANGTSPGNGFTDLVIPVDYRTTNATAEVGYNTPRYHIAASYSYSKLDSGFDRVTWTNPYFGQGIDTTYLARDNDYQRIAVNGTIRQLPWNSTLAARFTWDQLESDTPLATTALNGTAGVFGATNPNVTAFNGQVENTTFSLAWSAMPMNTVDTRVYYNYQERDNTSTQVEFRPVSGLNCGTRTVGGANQLQPCDNELYSYEKWNLGFDVFWRVARGHRVGGGFDYLHQDRHRPDYDQTKDKKLFAEYKNTLVEGLAARIRYTFLDRDSHFLLGDIGVNANDVLFLERFIGRFDAQGVKRHELKLTADWTPSPILDVSLEAYWKDNDWKRSGQEIAYAAASTDPRDDFLGRTSDRRWEIYASLSFGDPSKLRGTIFGDYEKIRYDSYHRNISTVSGGPTPPSGFCTAAAPNCYDPGIPATPQNYNWSANNRDKNWMAGVGVDWPALANLLVKASYLYVRTDGSADIRTQSNFGNPLSINAYDDTKTQSFNLKAIWDVARNWQVTAGYAYEKYDYSDDQYDGYSFVIPAASNQTSHLNGFNAFRDYKANIVYLLGTYRF